MQPTTFGSTLSRRGRGGWQSGERSRRTQPDSHLLGQQRWLSSPWIKQIQKQVVGLNSRVRGHQKQEVRGPIPRDEGGGSGKEGAEWTTRQGTMQRTSPKSKSLPGVGYLEQLHSTCFCRWIPVTQRISWAFILIQGSRDSNEETMENKRLLVLFHCPPFCANPWEKNKTQCEKKPSSSIKGWCQKGRKWMSSYSDMKLKISIRIDSIQLKETVEDVMEW